MTIATTASRRWKKPPMIQRAWLRWSLALGAAIYAGIGAGMYEDLREVVGRLVRFEATYSPDPVDCAAYDEHFDRWSKLYPRQLSLAEEGLLHPMWWPAGADA